MSLTIVIAASQSPQSLATEGDAPLSTESGATLVTDNSSGGAFSLVTEGGVVLTTEDGDTLTTEGGVSASILLVETVRKDGFPVAISTNATVSAKLVSLDGQTVLVGARNCDAAATGANWALGIVVAGFTSTEVSALTPGPPDIMLVLAGPGFVKRFRVHVESESVTPRSLLFVRDVITDELRDDQLILMAQNFFPGITLTDDFIWDSVKAAEAEISRALRVPLVPTQFYANPPDAETVSALPPNTPYAVDPAYDYDPDFFTGEKWGFLVLRKKPLISVSKIRFVYPAPTIGFYEIPGDWLRIDRRYAHIRFVPASSPFVAPLNAFILQALGGGRTIPFAIEVTYIAGLENPWRDYPELIDVVKKTAVLKILENGFFPQSGSISADGLSQSVSVDMQKYRDSINFTLNGPPGSNGGLMTAIHGIRFSALGN